MTVIQKIDMVRLRRFATAGCDTFPELFDAYPGTIGTVVIAPPDSEWVCVEVIPPGYADMSYSCAPWFVDVRRCDVDLVKRYSQGGGAAGQTDTLEAREAKWRAAWATHFAVSDAKRVAA